MRFILPLVFLLAQGLQAQTDQYRALAEKVLRETPLIDGHNDLPWTIRENAGRDVEAYEDRKSVV